VATVPNRRTQRRIGVKIPIQVFLPDRNQPITAMNQDISWGGAQFVAACPVARLSGMVRLVFTWRGNDSISIEAEVVRAQQLDDGHQQIAVRFASLSPGCQARLEKLLEMLSGRDGSVEPDSSSLVRELEVAVEDLGALRAMLMEIAAGCLNITVFESFEAGQSIRLSLRRIDDLPRIRLRARVLAAAAVKMDEFAQAGLFRLKLGFEHPDAAIKSFVDALLGQLPPVGGSPDSGMAGAPEWLRAIHLARDTENRRVLNPGLPSVLESRFPAALATLWPAWGDPELFDAGFRDLTLGSRAEPGGWPEDAWEELGFLQDVHDLAYGLPQSRRSALRPSRCR
jgi:hypothetical protein